MSGVKTAISLDEELFDRVNKLAGQLHISRSRLFAIAVKEYLKKQENQALLVRLNDAYSDSPDDEERKISRSMSTKLKKIVGQEIW
jgi:hypothetical protein